eukprot:CAMPEP_0202368174 /NCGR_PEP_ID=MMETSP1127-20130417/342_1 /ASSEMBLY_ACC=CAM_ASM_000462 /TAXON_ID=3047 /ORGANISM="Dunaliella tertiolecta, Strain CCMP1320" /LENGTH=1499 /DNA_ID=CAMNT_0048963543 /DNA_START=12 /DNA_END=4511 /DNA_ORIENTATION=+
MGPLSPSCSTQSLRFHLNGVVETVESKDANCSLNEWIRLHTRVKSCKLSCGEGGCGACAVAVQYEDPVTGKPALKSVNSCLTPAYAVSGCQVTTAEGLPKTKEGGVNPVIDRLVGFHATQCGFCTPGMAIACHTALAKAGAARAAGTGDGGGTSPNAIELRDALDGNLCRCTGYRPIVDACKSFTCDVDMEDLGLSTYKSLAEMQGTHAAPKCYTVHSAAAPAPAAVQPKAAPTEVIRIGDHQTLFVPHSLEQLSQAIQEQASSGNGVRMVAGNTGPGVYKDWPRHHPVLVCTTKVPELLRISHSSLNSAPALRVGSAVTLSNLLGKLTDTAGGTDSIEGMDAETQSRMREVWLGLAAHLKRVAGTHVRNSATVVGNLVLARLRGLPSDVATLMLAAGAHVELMDFQAAQGPPAVQTMPLLEFLGAGSDKPMSPPHPPVGATIASAKAGNKGLSEGLSSGSVLVTAVLLPLGQGTSEPRFWSSRVAERWVNAASLINGALSLYDIPGGGQARLVFGMDLGTTLGKHEWRVVQCPKVEAVLQQVASSPSAPSPSTIIPAALEALAEDLPILYSSTHSNGHIPNGHANGHANGPSLSNGSLANGHAHAGGEVPPLCSRAEFLRSVAEGLLLQGITALFSHSLEPGTDGKLLAPKLPPPQVIKGTQDLPPADPAFAPMMQPIAKNGALAQASGTATFVDDIPIEAGSLYGAYVCARFCKGKVTAISTADALKVPGAVRFVGPEDVPGHNLGVAIMSARGLMEEEPVFATDVQFYGEPVGMMLATSPTAAREAAQAVRVVCQKPDKAPVLSIEQAIAADSMHPLAALMPFVPAGVLPNSVMVASGDLDKAFAASPHVIRGGTQRLPSQTHMYMEPQTAIAVPDEEGGMLVHSSTQCQDGVLATVAAAIDQPHHKVNIKCRRLGGGFGGKASHASKVASAAAVAAVASKSPVRVAVDRNTDLAIFGGRCEVLVRYDVGFDDEGHILAVDMVCITMGGYYSSFSHFDAFGMSSVADNVYAIPAFRAQYQHARCNLPPRTTVRAPGDFPGLLIIENIVEHVAAALQLSPEDVRARNFRLPAPGTKLPGCPAGLANVPDLKIQGDAPEGQGPAQALTSTGKPYKVEQYTVPRIWEELKASSGFEAKKAAVEAFNAQHQWRKRGLSMIPCSYSLHTSQKSALVHVFSDGSVGVLHPGAEMGQGLAVKVLQTAAYELSKALPESQRPLPLSTVRALDPSTHALPHFSLTGGSTTSEQACEAVRLACKQLVERLAPFAKDLEGKDYDWPTLVGKVVSPMAGMFPKVALTSHGHGGLSGASSSYTTYGAAITEAEVDALTGERRVISSDILFDCGRSINPAVDLGQIEGAFVFGMGMMLSEHMEHDHASGAITSNSTWTYKVPSVTCVPERFSVSLLRDSPLHLEGPVSAKACGEPPLLLSSSVLFALQHAAHAAAQQAFHAPPPTASSYKPMGVPATVQAVKAACGVRPLAEVVREELAHQGEAKVGEGQ